MFSSRRLKAIALLVAVMAAGFVLFDLFLVKEASADCSFEQGVCDYLERVAWYICHTEGMLSVDCAEAQAYAVVTCIGLLHRCAWGG